MSRTAIGSLKKVLKRGKFCGSECLRTEQIKLYTEGKVRLVRFRGSCRRWDAVVSSSPLMLDSVNESRKECQRDSSVRHSLFIAILSSLDDANLQSTIR